MTQNQTIGEIRSEKIAAARLSVLSNSVLIVLKLGAGILSGSIGVLSEAAHSATDLAASVIALFSVRLADLPADDEHPYGHGKVESLSGMAEAVLIVLAALGIIYEAVNRLARRHQPPHVDVGIGVMALSLGVNILVTRYLFKVARSTDSLALMADAEHLRTDIFTSAGVLLGLGLVRLTGFTAFDSVVALGVAGLILFAAWGIGIKAVAPLMDTQLPPADLQALKDMLDAEPAVLGYHKLRTRKSGSARYVDAHIMVDDHLSLLEAHDLTERLEDRMRRGLPNAEITLHTEPFHAERRHQYEKHGGPPPEE